MKKTVTIISGHTGGLGNQLAKTLLGKNLIGISRTRNPYFGTKQIEADISKREFFDGEANSFNKRMNINLVLCAGTLGKKGGVYDADFDDWEHTFETNVLGNLRIIRSLLPEMVKAKYGRIVFLAGGGAAYAYPLFSGYAISKVAIVRAVENIAVEMKDKIDNFSIIALAPGAMETAMLEQVRKAGAEVRTTVPIEETATFIKNFLEMDKEKAKSLSGRFIHVRDDLDSEDFKNKWFLRRIE